MAQSGSDASLNVIPITDRSRMRPRQGAPAEVATVFMELVLSMPADHFRRTDAPLIEAYAQAIVLGREAYEHLQSEGQVIAGRTSPWVTCLEKAHRSAVALSMRLRLAPQSRLKAEAVGRSQFQPDAYSIRLIRGQAFIKPLSGCRLLLCLQCETGTVHEMELQPPAVVGLRNNRSVRLCAARG
jgi:Phage terminase, small subunit